MEGLQLRLQFLCLIGRFLKKSFLKPFCQIKQHFTGSIYMKGPHFILIGLKTWSSWAILVSDWLKYKKSSPLKLRITMNCYFVGMMYWRSCVKCL